MAAGFKRVGPVLLVAVTLALAAAPQASAATSRACNGGGGGPLGGLGESFPVELPGSLEAPVLGAFGVFRRPQQPSDQLPPVNPAGAELEGELSGYYSSEIRQVASLPDGRRFFVIPGLPRAFKAPPLGCFPKSVRKRLAKIFEEERKRQTEPRYCVIETGPRRGVASSECAAFADVASSQLIFSLSFLGSTTSAVLVPDGVASVRIVGPGTRRVQIPVSENAYLYTPPRGLVVAQVRMLRRLFKQTPKHPTKAQRKSLYRRIERVVHTIALKTEPSKVEWLGPGGVLVRSISRPPLAGGARATQRTSVVSTG